MAERITYRKSDKGHQIYRNAAGKRVPGTTTITGVMDKSRYLVPWANGLGLEGIESDKYVDSLATAGTLAHYLVECDLVGETPDPEYMREFSPIDIDRAETSMLKYLDWRKGKSIEVIGIELQLVSERYQFGGTLDILARVDGVLTLIDIKTCKGLYGAEDEKWTQVGGYDVLAEEHGYRADEARILRIGRDETEGFEYALSPDRELHRERFLVCRQLYAVTSKLRRVA